MINSLFLIAFAFLPWTLAMPHPDPIHVPILKRSKFPDHVAGLPRTVDAIKRKYGFATNSMKRTGETTFSSAPLTDESDISYSGVVSIGTPTQAFNLILDTGSSDLWVVTTTCTTCTSYGPLFDPSKSSTYHNATSILPIGYASGIVAGYVSGDTVAFGGFALPDQQFLAVDNVAIADGTLGDGLSGIMGLGFQNISTLQSPPFWQVLYNQNLLSEPVFGLYLERHVNQLQKADTAPGGTFTLGGSNSSLYTGDIEFIDMPSGTTPSYWLQQVQMVTIQGTSINVPRNSGLAAIDTGTTLIGVPSTISQEIWASVPGSVALTGLYEGMYGYPCTTDINITISFGGTSWAISAADMNFGTIDAQTGMCIGGTFALPELYLGSISVPSWVIGDVFLKNVYSVFRADPPAVGFAQLAGGAKNVDGLTTSGCATVGSPIPLALLNIVVSLLAYFSIIM